VATCSVAEEVELNYESITNDSAIGRLWLPATAKPSAAILLIGGSGGGYEDQDARWLASSGFVVFNIRYFGGKGQAENLVKVPIETFDKGIKWLSSHPAVKENSIGIFSHSRGTEAALLTAHYSPLVKAVVARSSSAVVWAGPGWAGFNESAWTWNSKPIAFLNVGLVDGAVWLYRVIRDKRLIQTRAMFASALHNKQAVEKAALPVAQLNAHLLLISGRDDQQWPSSMMSNMLIAKLEKSAVQYSYRHHAFDNAGHRPGHLSTQDDTFANGGTIAGNTHAYRETKVLVKNFFDENLK